MTYRKDPTDGKWRWMERGFRNPIRYEFHTEWWPDIPGHQVTIDGWLWRIVEP